MMMGMRMIVIATTYIVLTVPVIVLSTLQILIYIKTHSNPPLFSSTRRQDHAKVYERNPRIRFWEDWRTEIIPCGVFWSQVLRVWQRRT